MWGRFRGGAYRGHDTITVSPEFKAAQESDSAMPTYLVYLVLPDYAASAMGSTATSSGDADSDHPKEGAINSDHTEINIGAAATADDGVGKSSWKSSASPNGTGNVWLEINFGQSRIFNRVKLYNLAADPLTSYLLQYWDGGAWVDFAGTVDKYTPPSGIGGYGTGGYGFGPYGGSSSSWPIGPTGGLDVFDFAAITSTKIRLVVYATTSTGPAQLVELEVYRLVDITDRVRSIKGPDRKKDYKLSQPIATQEVLTVDNSDRFFSISYSPTAAEIAAGFINSDLALLGINLEVNEGFYTTVGKELIRTFTGSIDSITPTAGSASAEIVARDGIKHLMDQQDSCKLKTAIDITDCIRYILNRNGVSNYEMVLATTNITEPYFFYYEISILTVMQELVQAAGDAMFNFDENGTAVLQYYLTSTPQQYSCSTQIGWEAGTQNNVDSVNNAPNLHGPGQILEEFYLETPGPISSATVNSHPQWIVAAGTWEVMDYLSGGGLRPTSTSGAGTIYMAWGTPSSVGVWWIWLNPNNRTGAPMVYFNLMDSNATTAGGLALGNGYVLGIQCHPAIQGGVGLRATFNLYRMDNTPSLTLLASASGNNGGTITLARDISGKFTLYAQHDFVLQCTDNTYSNFPYLSYSGSNTTPQVGSFIGPYFSTALTGTEYLTTDSGSWISPTIDRGAITFVGIFQAVNLLCSSGSINYDVSTSDDGMSWGPWVSATPGAQDPSDLKRYERIRVSTSGLEYVYSGPPDMRTFVGLRNSILYRLSTEWFTGTAQQKWSPSIDFYLTDQNGICDLQEQIADNLAGDSAIINDVAVTAAPLVLTGANTDDQWQAITGTPPDKVSVANPLIVSAGTVTYNCVVSGGMDTSHMAGGSCIAITWGSATGSAAITYIHPTKPILTLTVTSIGTITDLRLIGKSFSNLQTPYQSLASDAASIARHRKRHADVNNNYFRDSSVTDFIAAKIISNQKDPVSYIPSFEIFPPRVNLQPGDRVNVVNEINGIATDYYVVGYSRTVEISESDASASMNLTLMKIPKV